MLLTSPGRMEIEEAVLKKMKGKKLALDDTPEEAAKEFKNTEDFEDGEQKEEDSVPTGDGCEESDATGDDEEAVDEEDLDDDKMWRSSHEKGESIMI